MKRSLLEIIVCPLCSNVFQVKNTVIRKNEIDSGVLQCVSCGNEYKISNGIPRIIDQNKLTKDYSLNFEMYWRKMNWNYPAITKKRFYELNEWTQGDVKGKFILDAACGGGRWTYQFAEEGAEEIIAVDHSTAIDRAKEICAAFDNIHFVQADLLMLPLPNDIFDIVHCHGAVHHIPKPNMNEAIKQLSLRVKPNGEFTINIFRNITIVQKIIDDILCGIVKRLPLKVTYYLAHIPTLFEYVPFAVPIFENVIHLSGQPNFTLKLLHNFDWYSSKYRYRTSEKEAIILFSDLGFKEIKVLNTNTFRVQSRFNTLRKIKQYLLKQGFFLKGTLGIRGKEKHVERARKL